MNFDKFQNISQFRKFGNRTSSLMTLHPHFSSFKKENESREVGEIKFVEKKNLVVIANEPLTHERDRQKIIYEFLNQTKYKNFDQYVFPISEKLSKELKSNGMHVWQIGSEPIFHLDNYFNADQDPLDFLPIARNLKKRGAKVFEISEAEFLVHKERIEEITEESLANKRMGAFEFLNIVEPLSHTEYKRFFILEDRKEIKAFLTALPVFHQNQIIAYYFNDIFKSDTARSASNELLIIEAMRLMQKEGVLEVRLGMAPLARIHPDEKDADKLTNLFQKMKWGYNFKSLYEFKNKLSPTRWRPVYLASNRKSLKVLMINVMRVHLTKGAYGEFIKRTWYLAKQKIKLKERFLKYKNEKAKSGLELIYRTKGTLSLFAFFVGLHLLKVSQASFLNLYQESAYIPGQVSAKGLFLGPLFHNSNFHLFGDQLSFVVFAGFIEYTFGLMPMLLITALGLWLSNPLTKLVLASTLNLISPEKFANVLVEKDWGSSNAVFSLVGACLFVLKDKAWLFWPFFIHALYISFHLESFLSTHHFIGIYLGYAGFSWYFLQRDRREKLAASSK